MAKRQQLLPRVFSSVRAPRYPRALGIGTMLVLGACCKTTPTESETTDPANTVDPTMLPGGTPPPVYTDAVADAGSAEPEDAATRDADAAPAAKKKKKQPKPLPPPPGVPPPPFSSR